MKKTTLSLIIFAAIFAALPGCTKQEAQPLPVATTMGLPKTFNRPLFDLYIDYELAVERKSLWNKPITIRLSRARFDSMIDNYLLGEAITMRANAARPTNGTNTKPTPDIPPAYCLDINGNIVPCRPTGSGGTDNSVSCTGKFTDNSAPNTIIFVADLNKMQTAITADAFAFGGVGATWAPVGNIQQDTYNGVITYKQYYTETYNIPTTGVSDTELFVIYGNIYHGKCTVTGSDVPKQLN